MAAMAGAMLGGAAISGVTSAIGSGKQADATKKAAQLESQSAANSLGFNKQVYGDTLANEAPYRSLGSTAAGMLSNGLADGSLTAAYPGGQFSFTGVNLQNDPAYQFDLQQGQQAIQRSAAAQGGLVSGGAMRDLNDYSQGYASNQFQQSYTNALAAYQQAYNQFENQQGNTFNRLSSVAGLGQNAATQTATSGNAAAGANAAINGNTANALSNLYTGQGNAGAAATISAGNSMQSGLNNYANYLAMKNASSYAPSSAGMYDAASGTQLPGAPAYEG